MKKMLVLIMTILLIVLPFMSSCGIKDNDVSPMVVISKSSINLSVGDVYTLSASVFPKKYKDLEVIWSVSDSDIIECVDGKVSAKAPGIALVYAIAGSSRYNCKVTVGSRKTMIVDETITLSTTQKNLIVGAKNVFSTAPDVLSYDADSGTITANKQGEGKVVAEFENGDRVSVASVSVKDIGFECKNGMPYTFTVNSELGADMEVYDLRVEKQLYEECNYFVNFEFKAKLTEQNQTEPIRAEFRVTLYSGEYNVENGGYCRHRDIFVDMIPGDEYRYIDDGFLAELLSDINDGNRTFWIEITPITEEDGK